MGRLTSRRGLIGIGQDAIANSYRFNSKIERKLAWKPQKGYQEMFYTTRADIAIGGGSAGSGKTAALLMDCANPNHLKIKGYNATIFRRSFPQITNPGGLLDESRILYEDIGGKVKLNPLDWKFETGAKISFRHIQYDKSVYDYQGSQICKLCFDELTHFCLLPTVEVLTKNGWEKITEVKNGELVASYSQSREIEYKKANLVSFNYDGEMLKAENQSISMTVTPNHRIVQDKSLTNSKKNKGNHYGGWKFNLASNAYNKTIRVPRTGGFEGKEQKEYQLKLVTGRGLGKNSNIVEKIKMDNWLAFLGWYFSEGSAFENINKNATTGRGSPRINIRQTRTEHKEEIREVMNNLGFKWVETKDGQFNIHSRQLFEELIKYGKGAKEKRIPRWLFELSIRQIEIFLKAFEKGDGHRGKSNEMQIGLCNEGLIDDLQELYFLCGKIANKRYLKTRTGFDTYSLYVREKGQNTAIVKNQWSKIAYKGKIHCLQVEDNHTFLVRDKGNYYWTGNSEEVVFYMLSRNRSGCGVKPTVRATCNPDADSWVAKFIEWWIDQESGLPIKERRGKLRYFIRREDETIWGDSEEELQEKYGDDVVAKSATFIYGTAEENQKLLEKDPNYIANLQALHPVEKARLLYGNWKVRFEAGAIFDRHWFTVIDEILDNESKGIEVRFWDMAATAKDTASKQNELNKAFYTANMKMHKIGDNYYITDVKWQRIKGGNIEQWLLDVASEDGEDVRIRWELEGGSAAKIVAESFREKLLAHNGEYDVRAIKPQGDKVTRALKVASCASRGEIFVLNREWTNKFLNSVQDFDGSRKPLTNDIVDCLSGCFNELEKAVDYVFDDNNLTGFNKEYSEDKFYRSRQ